MAQDKDPDASVIALFRQSARRNEGKSATEGRPIYDDMEICELRYPGSKNVGVYPALSFSHWAFDPITGGQKKVTYAERFPRQYQQFKSKVAQTKGGTPLEHAPFLTEARRAEFRAQNIYTVEALAEIEGAPLKNLGPGGRDLKNAAMKYIEEAKSGAGTAQMKAEHEALMARLATLEEDNKVLKARQAAEPGAGHPLDVADGYTKARDSADAIDPEFDGMSLDQLRDYINANTGHPPHGSLNRKTLTRMCQEARPKTKAA